MTFSDFILKKKSVEFWIVFSWLMFLLLCYSWNVLLFGGVFRSSRVYLLGFLKPRWLLFFVVLLCLFVCLFVTMLPLEFLDKFCFLECWDILPKVFANIWGIGDRMQFRPTGWNSWERWFKNRVLHGLCYTIMTSIRATRGLNWNMECWGWSTWIYF